MHSKDRPPNYYRNNWNYQRKSKNKRVYEALEVRPNYWHCGFSPLTFSCSTAPIAFHFVAEELGNQTLFISSSAPQRDCLTTLTRKISTRDGGGTAPEIAYRSFEFRPFSGKGLFAGWEQTCHPPALIAFWSNTMKEKWTLYENPCSLLLSSSILFLQSVPSSSFVASAFFLIKSPWNTRRFNHPTPRIALSVRWCVYNEILNKRIGALNIIFVLSFEY